VLKEQKRSKLLQYGERIFGITEGSEDERIDLAIEKTEEFFRTFGMKAETCCCSSSFPEEFPQPVGMKTRLSEVGIGNETIEKIADRFNKAGVAYGENGNVTGDVAREILKSCK